MSDLTLTKQLCSHLVYQNPPPPVFAFWKAVSSKLCFCRPRWVSLSSYEDYWKSEVQQSMLRFRFCEMWRRVVWYMVTKFLYLEYRCKILTRGRRLIPTRLYGTIYQNTVVFMACLFLAAIRWRNVLTNYKRLRNAQLWTQQCIYSILIVSGRQLWTYDRRKSESREVARHTAAQTREYYRVVDAKVRSVCLGTLPSPILFGGRGGGFNKFSWDQRTERMGDPGAVAP